MSVRKRLNLITALVFIAAAIAAAAMYFSHQQVVRQSAMLRQSGDMEASLERLNALTAACMTSDDAARRKLWLTVYAKARNDLAAFRTAGSAEDKLLSRIARLHDELMELFTTSVRRHAVDQAGPSTDQPAAAITEVASAIVTDGRRLRQHFVKELLAAETHAKQVVLAVLLLLMWLNVATVLIVRQSALQPIEDLQRAAERIAGGDMAVRLDPRTHSEAGAAVKAFNDMVGAISERHRRISERLTQALGASAIEAARVEAALEDTRDQLRNQSELRAVAEQAAAVHACQIEAILRAFPEVMYVADPETYEVLFVNDRFREMLGADPVGGTCYAELHGRETPCEFCTNALLRETGGACQQEIYNAKLDRYFMATDLPIQWPTGGGLRPARLQVSIDSTWARAIQKDRQLVIRELERKNMELERFTRTVSHELKGPVVTITGFTSFLEADLDAGRSEAVREDVSRVSQAAHDMERTIDELLHLSFLRNQPVRVVDVSLGEVIGESIDRLSLDLARGRIALSVAPDLPTLRTDRPRIAYVLRNLMEHAIRSVRGQADPRIEIGWLESRAGDPVIFIRHNGVGMDRAEQEGSADLLEPSVSDTYGLALAPSLARQVVEDLAGRLWAHSSGPSQGVTFLLTVPQEPPCEEGQATVADRQCALQSR